MQNRANKIYIKCLTTTFLTLASFQRIWGDTTWTATTNNNLTTATNWSNGVPNAANAADFGATSQSSPMLNASTITTPSFTFVSGAPSYTFTFLQGVLNLTSTTGIQNATTNPQTFQLQSLASVPSQINFNNAATTPSNVETINYNLTGSIISFGMYTDSHTNISLGSASTLNCNGDVNINFLTSDSTSFIHLNSQTLTIDTGSSLSLAGPVTGNNPSSLVKSGTGTLKLTNISDTFGTLDVAAGLVIASPPQVLDGVTQITNDARLELDGPGNTSGITGSGIVQINTNGGNGTLVSLGGTNTYTGGTTISSGTLESSPINMPSGGSVSIASGAFFDLESGGTFSGLISGNGKVTINNHGASGMVTLSNASNSYSGGTLVTQGTLQGSVEGAIPGTGAAGIVDNATVDFSYNGTYGGPISGTGDVTVEAGSGHTLLFSQPATYTGSTEVNSGTLEMDNQGAVRTTPIALASGTNIAFNQTIGTPATVTGQIRGTGALLINNSSGTGTVIVNNTTNSFTGGTTISGGTLQTTTSLPGNVVDNGTLDFEQAANTSGTFAGQISGTGAVEINSTAGNTGTVKLNNTNTYSGTTTISRGTLLLTNVTLPNSSSIVDNGNLDFEITSGSLTYSHGISGSGNLLLNAQAGNAGTLVLNGPTTYTGTTTIGGGTLKLDNTIVSGNITDNGNLDLELTSGSETYNNVISGNGNVLINSTAGNNGTVKFNNTNTYRGTTTISGGTLLLTNVTLPNSSSIVDNGNLDFEITSGSLVYNKGISGSGNLLLNAQAGNAGILVLDGPTTYTGTTTIGGGTLKLDNTIVSGSIIDNGNLDLEIASGSETYNNVISGSGNVLINATAGNAGTVKFNNTNTYSGTTTISGGTLLLTNVTLPNSSSIVDNGNLDFEITSGSLTYSHGISGSGNLFLNKQAGNAGTLVLSGGTTYTGTTTIGGGTLKLDNTIVSGNITDNGNLDLEITSGSETYNNVISGNGNVLINSTAGNIGTVKFNKTNTYRGTTTISGGTLLLTNVTLPNSSSIVDNGNLDFEITSGSLAYNKGISGSGNLLLNAQAGNAGTLVLSGGTTYTGTTTIGGGTLKLDNTIVSGSITDNGNLDLEITSGSETYNNVISGTGNVLINSTAGNNGTVEFNNTNTYSGTTTISGGTLLLDNVTLPNSSSIVDNGNLDYEITSGSLAYSHGISGSGKLMLNNQANRSGKLILSGNNTYTGTTTIDNGTLQLNNTLVQGDIIDNGTLDFEKTSGSETYGKNIEGSGKVVINSIAGNTGTVVFNGVNTYSGGTTVANGTLQGTTSSLQGSIAIDPAASLTFNQQGTGIFRGVLSGSGKLNIIDPGQVNIETNNSSFTGSTTVSNAILLLDGILGGQMNVQSNGVLTGGGSLLSSLVMNTNSTISPAKGESPATFHVGGHFEQQSNSTYSVLVSSGGVSLIDVAGTATLENNTTVAAHIRFPLGESAPGVEVTVPILHAGSGVSGKYTFLTVNNPLFAARLTYDPFNVFLSYFSHLVSVPTQTQNQRNVITQLEAIETPTPEELVVLLDLINLPADQSLLLLDQLSGQQYTNAFLIAEDAVQQFIRGLYNPLRKIISNPCYSRCGCHDETALVWSQISGSRNFYHGNVNAKGFKSRGFEVSLGSQTPLDDNLTVGVAGSYQFDRQHYNIGGHGQTHAVFGGIYGLYRPQGYYVLGDFALGHSWGLVRRQINAPSVHLQFQGRPAVNQSTFYLEIGKDRGRRSLLIQPFLGLEIDSYHISAFHEHPGNPFNLAISKRNHTNVYTRLGVHLTPLGTNDDYLLNVDFAWRYRCTSLGDRLKLRFRDFGGVFGIQGFALHRCSIEGALNFAKKIDDHWRIFVEVDGQGWRKNVSYSFVGGVEAEW